MAALRIDWYSLISMHKSASKVMLFQSHLMILDHLSREIEL